MSSRILALFDFVIARQASLNKNIVVVIGATPYEQSDDLQKLRAIESGGIGWHMALQAAEQGAARVIAVGSFSGWTTMNPEAEDVLPLGIKGLRHDVGDTSPAAVEAFFEKMMDLCERKFPDYIIFTAGKTKSLQLWAELPDVYAVDLVGTHVLADMFADKWRSQKRGFRKPLTIGLTSSFTTEAGTDHGGGYVPGKAGIEEVARGLKRDHPLIRVVCYVPGVILTKLWKQPQTVTGRRKELLLLFHTLVTTCAKWMWCMTLWASLLDHWRVKWVHIGLDALAVFWAPFPMVPIYVLISRLIVNHELFMYFLESRWWPGLWKVMRRLVNRIAGEEEEKLE